MPADDRPARDNDNDDTVTKGGDWSEFRIDTHAERLRVLRELRDGGVPVMISSPAAGMLMTTLWTLDDAQQRLTFNAVADTPQLDRMVEANEAVAMAYCDSVKLQFDLHGMLLIRGARASALQCALPRHVYRFQRRNAYRVRPPGHSDTPVARLRHPAMPEMALSLRVVDISIGGCALWLPDDIPALEPGSLLGDVRLQLDAQTAFSATVLLHHVASMDGATHAAGRGDNGVRLGCEWQSLPGGAERVLQRWIDQAQKRRRLLSIT